MINMCLAMFNQWIYSFAIKIRDLTWLPDETSAKAAIFSLAVEAFGNPMQRMKSSGIRPTSFLVPYRTGYA